jgi:transcriptional regulator with XRE-family HTH domain
LGEIRRQEGLRPDTVARRLGISIGQLLAQEQPTADIRLSDLYRWQAALGVPASELLEESGCDFSRPTRLRATLLRVMKTVRSIQEQAREDSIRRLAERLAGDLVGMMPELEGTAAWPTLGQRGKARDLGQAFFRRIGLDAIDDLDAPEE